MCELCHLLENFGHPSLLVFLVCLRDAGAGASPRAGQSTHGLLLCFSSCSTSPGQHRGAKQVGVCRCWWALLLWGQRLRYGAGRHCPWGGLMSLGTSSGPPAPHQGAAKVGHSPAPWGQDGSCRSHPSLSSPAPPELNRLISIKKKKKTEGREKEQQWQERERLSRALHKNDKLLLDIGQERKRVLLYLMILVS